MDGAPRGGGGRAGRGTVCVVAWLRGEERRGGGAGEVWKTGQGLGERGRGWEGEGPAASHTITICQIIIFTSNSGPPISTPANPPPREPAVWLGGWAVLL